MTMSMHVLGRTLGALAVVAAVFVLPLPNAGSAYATAVDKERSESYFREARSFVEKGEIKAAVIQLKNALRENPDNVAARILLGDIYIRTGNAASAEKELRAARRRGVDTPHVRILLARAYLLQGKYEKAFGLIEGTEVEGKQVFEFELTRAQALLGLRRFDDSAEAFRKADATNPDDVRARVGLAQVLVNQGKIKQAEIEADIALARNPKSQEALVLKGELRRLDKDLEGAVAQFNRVIEVNGRNMLARLGRAAALIDLNRDAEATADIDAVVERIPRHPLAGYLKALVLSKARKYADAQEALQGTGRGLDNHMPSVFLAGALHYALGQLEQAVQKLTRYVSMVPGNGRARKLLGAALVRKRDPMAAIEVLRPLLQEAPDDAQVLTLMGSAHMQAGKFNEGNEYFTKAAESAPDVASIRTQIALSDLARGRADSAMGELEKALDLDPGAGQAGVLLALVKLRKGDFDGALAAARSLSQKMPDNPLPLNLMGAAYLGKNDIEMARKTFEETLVRHPDFQAARMNLAQLDLREGNLEAARKQYEKVLSGNPKHLGAMMALAGMALRDKRNEDVVSWLQKAGEANPKSVAPRLQLIRFYGRSKQFRKALSVARELKRNRPNDPRVLEALGRTEMVAGEPISAVATFQRLADLTPKSARVMGLLAGAQLGARDRAGARETLRRAIEVDANYAPAYVGLAELEMRVRHFDDAMKVAEQARSKHPKSSVGDMLVGDVLIRQERFDDAAKAYLAGLGKSDTAGLAIRRFNARRQGGAPTAALSELQSWVDRKGDRTARHVLASAYISVGRHDEAIRESEKLLADDGKNPVLLNNLAWLYQQKGDGRARDYAERAFEIAPKSPSVMDTLGWILVNAGEPERGLQLLKKAAAAAPKQGDIQFHMAAALYRNGQTGKARWQLEALLGTEFEFSKRKEARDLLRRLRAN